MKFVAIVPGAGELGIVCPALIVRSWPHILQSVDPKSVKSVHFHK